MTIVAIIPARGGSKRLPGKNIQPFFGRPMVAWAIESCRSSRYIDHVFVSSDDEKVLEIADVYGAGTIARPHFLADDKTPKIEAIRHADQWLRENMDIAADIIVSVQANSPEIRASDIDRGIEMFQTHDRWEVFSIDKNDLMNGAFRILRTDCIHNSFLSAHMGVIRTDYIDIHTHADLDDALKKYRDVDDFMRWKRSDG